MVMWPWDIDSVLRSGLMSRYRLLLIQHFSPSQALPLKLWGALRRIDRHIHICLLLASLPAKRLVHCIGQFGDSGVNAADEGSIPDGVADMMHVANLCWQPVNCNGNGDNLCGGHSVAWRTTVKACLSQIVFFCRAIGHAISARL